MSYFSMRILFAGNRTLKAATLATLVTLTGCVIGGRPNGDLPSSGTVTTGGSGGATAWGTPGGSEYLIMTSAVHGTKMYVGGYASYYGSPNAEGAVILDPATGERPASVTGWPNFYYTLAGAPSTSTFDFTTGVVHAMVADPNEAGAFFVGGKFSHVDGIPQANLARIKPDGSLDPSWTTTTDDVVYALTTDGTALYVGGKFGNVTDSFGTHATRRMAKVNLTTAVISTSFTSSLLGTAVYALAMFPSGRLAVGGDMNECGGTCFNYVVMSRTTAGVFIDGGAGADGIVYAIATDGTGVYVGGAFTTFMGVANTRLAAVDASNSAALFAGFTASTNGEVRALAIDGTQLYVGGGFSTINATAFPSLGRLNKATGVLDATWAPVLGSVMNGSNPTIHSIYVNASRVYLGGAFNRVNGEARVTGAAVDKTTGTSNIALNLNFRSEYISHDLGITAFVESGGRLIVGGALSSYGGEARPGVAEIDLETGQPTSWNPVMDVSLVMRTVVVDDLLYVSGQFSTIDGQARPGVAAFDLSSGTPVLTSWDPSPLVGGGITDMDANSTTVFVGGSFTSIGGQLRSKLAAFDHGSNTPNAWAPTIDASLQSSFVGAIEAYEDAVYIWGTFGLVNGTDIRAGLAELDAVTGATTAWNPDIAGGLTGSVKRVGSNVLIAGSFTTVNGGTVRPYLAAVHATTGADLGWAPAPNDDVFSISSVGDYIYLGGDFTSILGSTRGGLARVRSSDLSLSSWTHSLLLLFAVSVHAIDGDPSDSLYVAGGAWGNSLNGDQPSMNCGITRLKAADGSLMLPE